MKSLSIGTNEWIKVGTMGNGKGSALVIMSLIIGAIGVGMGTYSAISFSVIEGPQGDPGTDGADGNDGINGTLNNLIGVWESVDGGPDNIYRLNFSDNQLTEDGFFVLEESNNFTLTRPGWYRFSLKFLWYDLDITNGYRLSISKNGVGEHYIEMLFPPPSTQHFVDTEVTVYSDGDDNFVFYNAYVGTPDSTYVYSTQIYNQLLLEYVKEA